MRKGVGRPHGSIATRARLAANMRPRRHPRQARVQKTKATRSSGRTQYDHRSRSRLQSTANASKTAMKTEPKPAPPERWGAHHRHPGDKNGPWQRATTRTRSKRGR